MPEYTTGQLLLFHTCPLCSGHYPLYCSPEHNQPADPPPCLPAGIVDESNPYDKLPLSVTIPSADPLYRQKRDKLAAHSLSTQQTFQLQRNQVG